ncbi:unnamed protein product [Cuscuta epithymum]|uniref:Uncharacterized protein n=1 Tax=Cuscuta epithymum TaxID=186058 RepID=A0AAV0CTT6_9ASTE|nr:unnamed protein product [Cuscuta epithymum]
MGHPKKESWQSYKGREYVTYIMLLTWKSRLTQKKFLGWQTSSKLTRWTFKTPTTSTLAPAKPSLLLPPSLIKLPNRFGTEFKIVSIVWWRVVQRRKKSVRIAVNHKFWPKRESGSFNWDGRKRKVGSLFRDGGSSFLSITTPYKGKITLSLTYCEQWRSHFSSKVFS